MSSTRDIQHKIRTVRSIEQITRAMKTVASIRLRRAEARVARARPYWEELAELVSRVASVTQAHRYLEARGVERTAVALVTSDRGLCGGYNMSAVRRAVGVGRPEEVVVAAVGRKGLGQMRRRGYEIVEQLAPLGGEPELAQVRRLADRVGARYEAGEVDRVVLVYARFRGGTSHTVEAETVLPAQAGPEMREAIFEPKLEALLPGLMRRYLWGAFGAAVLEASASEHAARVAAMTAATDNAEEMIRDLVMDYNRARQAGITKELTEIVSAAEATA